MYKPFFKLFLFIGLGILSGCNFTSGENAPKDVVWVFTANGCKPCDAVVQLFKTNKIEFEEFNIYRSEKNMQRFLKYGGKQLPLTFIAGERIEGFDESLLRVMVNSLHEYQNIDPQKVVMYSSVNCHWCAKAHDFFKRNNIAFTEYFIDASPENQRAFKALNGNGTPLILIGPNRITGFNERAVRIALEKAGLM